MFYLLSKTLFLLAMPMTWLIFLLLYAWLKKRSRQKNRVIACTLLYLFLAGNPTLVNKILLWWEVDAIPFAEIKEPYEVGIILSGAVNMYKSPMDRVHIPKAADRMLHAAELYHRGLVKRFIITGGYPEPRGQVADEATDMQHILRICQVPDSAIILEPLAKNTRENALNTAAILQEQFPDIEKPLLITSAFHMRRSIACFNKAGIEVVPFSTDFYTIDADKSPLGIAFWPREDAFQRFFVWIHEVVGLIVYKILGYA